MKPILRLSDVYRYVQRRASIERTFGNTKHLAITEKAQKGLALRQLLFSIDTVWTHIQDQPVWLMMYADDIALLEVTDTDA